MVTLGGAGGGVLKFVNKINDLTDTIRTNKEAVARMEEENAAAHEELRRQIRELVRAIRLSRRRDQEVITNLRIAVAALQSAQAVRDGRSGYAGASSAPASVELPRTRREREEQATEAMDDAEAAIMDAEMAQEAAGDPLAGLANL